MDQTVILILLNRWADVEIKDEYGMTALISAALFNQTTTASLLLDRSADIDVQDKGSHCSYGGCWYGYVQCCAYPPV